EGAARRLAAADRGEDREHEALDRGERVAVVLGQQPGADAVDQRQLDLVAHRSKERRLVREVEVDGPAREARRARDLLERGVRVAVPLELRARGLDQAGARLGGFFLGTTCHHFVFTYIRECIYFPLFCPTGCRRPCP